MFIEVTIMHLEDYFNFLLEEFRDQIKYLPFRV